MQPRLIRWITSPELRFCAAVLVALLAGACSPGGNSGPGY
jgi:hypothetical protein